MQSPAAGGGATPLPAPAPSPVPAQAQTSAVDLVLPLLAVGAASTVAGYGFFRRVRRSRRRTTPGAPAVPPPSASAGSTPSLTGADERSRAALVLADDRIRSARSELRFATELFGDEATAPYAHALREAEKELGAAFRMRQRYDKGIPEEEAARRHTLAGIVGRCEEAERRLDAVTVDFVQLRGLESRLGQALGLAESLFRELTGRTAAAESLLADLGARYAATTSAHVTGDVEQAKDRLLFATVRLNQARQADDLGRAEDAARHLRAAEGAIGQAAVFVEGVERTAAGLREAEAMIPALLTGVETELSGVRESAGLEDADLSRLPHADAVLASVRRELSSGQPYDPVGVLRRIVRAIAPLTSDGGRGRRTPGVLRAAALLVARDATAAADDFVATHRAAVGFAPRTHLAEARRLLAAGAPADVPHADALALEAREEAERDVRVRGNPSAGPSGLSAATAAGETETATSPAAATAGTAGTAGVVLGGVLPAEDPDGGRPAGFGGATSALRTD
ncbi:hypothetical protein [Streptomyces sp. NPDC002328]|uniref:hypothetical protein n=1 Tax=Streptomyces sp. NPDC002328 TaxID=3364642 RepID=UPI003686F5A6